MSIEAMQQALNALKCFQSDAYETSEKRGLWLDAEIASLHQAIEQAEQIEPEDWRHYRHFHEQAERQQALDKKADNARKLGLDYESTHTDHPMRHWDRTCPACVEQEPQYKPVATIHIRYGTALVDCPCCANKLTITFTDPPRKEWVGMTSQEVDEIREQIFQEHTTALLNNKEINEENDYGAWNFYQRIERKLKDRNT